MPRHKDEEQARALKALTGLLFVGIYERHDWADPKDVESLLTVRVEQCRHCGALELTAAVRQPRTVSPRRQRLIEDLESELANAASAVSGALYGGN